MQPRSRPRFDLRRGFTLLELAAVLAVGSVVLTQVMPMAKRARNNGRGMSSAANLMSIGQGAGMYGLDNEDRIFSYTWGGPEPGSGVVPRYTLPSGETIRATSDLLAASAQQTDILQRRTGRFGTDDEILFTSERVPHRRTIGLILLEYLGRDPGDPMFIDPNDANQINWSANPLDSGPGSGVPYADGIPAKDGYDTDAEWANEAVRQRWAFTSSYQTTTAAWHRSVGDQLRYAPVASSPHLFQLCGLGMFSRGAELSDGRRFDEVWFPGKKVYFFEEFDRERDGDPYFAYPQARVEKLMFDGSVDRQSSRLAQTGPSPCKSAAEPWSQRYLPLDAFPLPLSGLNETDELPQPFRWTRLGLFGVDYTNRGPTAPTPPSTTRSDDQSAQRPVE